MGPPPAPLPDEIIEEILLRIPPSDPATLARAAVAQKRWCRLVAGPGFRRRYRAHHRVPPTLGFFCDPRGGDGFSTSFVPASSFRPMPRGAEHRELRPEDARHGRVLLRGSPVMFGIELRGFGLVVWYPISGHRIVLPRPKGFCDKWNWKAMVLCAAPAGSCDHLDCHRGHFIVVLIGNYPNGMLSCVYSSQAGAWSKITFVRHLGWACRLSEYREKCSAHMGNALYYMLDKGNKILKYDLGTREFSVMEPPPLLSCEETHSEHVQLTTMEDGQLGLVVLRQSALYILSTDEEFGWRGTKIIDLEKCRNYVPSIIPPFLIGFAGDIGLVFLNAGDNGILSVDTRSAQVKVFYNRACISRIVPYINFCTPVMGVRKRQNGTGVVSSGVGRSCVANRLLNQVAMGVPSKVDKPRAGASRDLQSCVASSLLGQVMAVRKGKYGPGVGASSGGQSSVATRLPNQAMGVPSKDDRPRAGDSSDPRSCVASSLLSQANGTGGWSQQPVGGHRARAVKRLQPRLHLATRPARFSWHDDSPSPEGK